MLSRQNNYYKRLHCYYRLAQHGYPIAEKTIKHQALYIHYNILIGYFLLLILFSLLFLINQIHQDVQSKDTTLHLKIK